MTSQYGAHEFRAEYARLHAHARMHTPTHPGTRTHALARTHKRNIYCFSTAVIIRESASILRHAHIAYLVVIDVVTRVFLNL